MPPGLRCIDTQMLDFKLGLLAYWPGERFETIGLLFVIHDFIGNIIRYACYAAFTTISKQTTDVF